MTKAIIEIVEDGGKLKYAITKSGNQKIDQLADVAVGSLNLYAQTGGNMQNLMGTLGGDIRRNLGTMLMGGGM